MLKHIYQCYPVVLIGAGLVKLGTLQLQARDLLKLQVSFNSVAELATSRVLVRLESRFEHGASDCAW